MKLSEIKGNDDQLDEILPVIGAVGAGLARGAAAAGGMLARGAAKVGSMAAQGIAKGATKAAGALGNLAAKGAGNLAAKAGAGNVADPAQLAQQKAEVDGQKKELQQAIQLKQKEILDLQKQMAELSKV